MVAVAVRTHDGAGCQRMVLQVAENRLRVETGVDHDAVVPPGQMRNIGIFVERGRNNSADVKLEILAQ